MNKYAIANALVAAAVRLDRSTRPVDKTKWNSELEGMAKILDVMGLAMTPFQVRMAIIRSMEANGRRPLMRATGGNEPVHEWDHKVALGIMIELKW